MTCALEYGKLRFSTESELLAAWLLSLLRELESLADSNPPDDSNPTNDATRRDDAALRQALAQWAQDPPAELKLQEHISPEHALRLAAPCESAVNHIVAGTWPGEADLFLSPVPLSLAGDSVRHAYLAALIDTIAGYSRRDVVLLGGMFTRLLRYEAPLLRSDPTHFDLPPVDGVRLVYRLTGAGWSECEVEIDGQHAFTSASYLSNALGSLVDAVVELLLGADDATAVFDEEPGEYRWRFRVEHAGDDTAQGVATLHLTILVFAELWTNRPDSEGEVIFDAHCPLPAFAAALQRALDALIEAHGVDGYRALWGEHDFPSDNHALLIALNQSDTGNDV